LAKKKEEKPQRAFTKRQISRRQRQQRTQRIIIVSGIVIIAAVLGTITAGWVINDYQPLRQTVTRVNDTEFSMGYYVKALKYYGGGIPGEYLYYFNDEIVKNVQEGELVRQAAMKLDISVSDYELDKHIEYNHPSPDRDLDAVNRNAARTELLLDKLLDNYFEQQIPVSAEQRHILAMFLENESQAAEVRKGLEAGEDFASYAEELSQESVSKEDKGDLGWQSEEVLSVVLDTSTPGEYAFNAEVGVLSQPVYDEEKTKNTGYWLIKVLDRNEEDGTSHIHAILLGSEEEALAVKAEAEAGGEYDFDLLAEEHSQHSPSNEDHGCLGYLAPGTMSEVFDEYAFDPELEMDKISQPIRDDTVQTKGGYWLIKVVDIDNDREIESDDRDLLKDKALDDWIAALWDDPNNVVESYLDDEQIMWAIERATGS
jgi:parvulin-like peptidyl-prolyl isomerase